MMSPFCRFSGGGSQDRHTMVPITTTKILLGGPLGAVKEIKFAKYKSSCHALHMMNRDRYIMHTMFYVPPSPVVKSSTSETAVPTSFVTLILK